MLVPCRTSYVVCDEPSAGVASRLITVWDVVDNPAVHVYTRDSRMDSMVGLALPAEITAAVCDATI